jgi:hypothetical protein
MPSQDTTGSQHVGKTKKMAKKRAAGSTILAGTQGSSEFHLVKSRAKLPLAPVFAGDWEAGVREILSGWTMKCVNKKKKKKTKDFF